MYTGMALLIAGEGLMLPAITSAMLVEAAGFVVLAALFVMLYEEPALRRRFGGDYEAYCKEVRRWIPRLLPFDKGNPAAVRSPDLE